MDNYKKVQTYLRLAELCTPDEDEDRKRFMKLAEDSLNTINQMSESPNIVVSDGEIYIQGYTDKERAVFYDILKYKDMLVPKDWNKWRLTERIEYTRDYLLGGNQECDCELVNIKYITNLIVFHEILGNPPNKKMSDKVKVKINGLLREAKEHGYAVCNYVSCGVAYPRTRGYKRLDEITKIDYYED